VFSFFFLSTRTRRPPQCREQWFVAARVGRTFLWFDGSFFLQPGCSLTFVWIVCKSKHYLVALFFPPPETPELAPLRPACRPLVGLSSFRHGSHQVFSPPPLFFPIDSRNSSLPVTALHNTPRKFHSFVPWVSGSSLRHFQQAWTSFVAFPLPVTNGPCLPTASTFGPPLDFSS